MDPPPGAVCAGWPDWGCRSITLSVTEDTLPDASELKCPVYAADSHVKVNGHCQVRCGCDNDCHEWPISDDWANTAAESRHNVLHSGSCAELRSPVSLRLSEFN
jgi:hypothetical protein